MGILGALLVGGAVFLLTGGILIMLRGSGARSSSGRAVTPQGGVPLLCRLGSHAWRRVLVGRGRDTRYVVKCVRCEAYQDDL